MERVMYLRAYAKAKFVIETNAKGQAKSDADTTPLLKAMQYLSDPKVIVDAVEVLHHWTATYDTSVVFTNLDKSDYEALTEIQKAELVEYWCQLFPVLVIEYLKKRLERR